MNKSWALAHQRCVNGYVADTWYIFQLLKDIPAKFDFVYQDAESWIKNYVVNVETLRT